MAPLETARVLTTPSAAAAAVVAKRGVVTLSRVPASVTWRGDEPRNFLLGGAASDERSLSGEGGVCHTWLAPAPPKPTSTTNPAYAIPVCSASAPPRTRLGVARHVARDELARERASLARDEGARRRQVGESRP